jgi:hypothetical protein
MGTRAFERFGFRDSSSFPESIGHNRCVGALLHCQRKTSSDGSGAQGPVCTSIVGMRVSRDMMRVPRATSMKIHSMNWLRHAT